MNKREIRQKKKSIINEQKPEKELLEQEYSEKRKIEKTCFWTWPWGHVWQHTHLYCVKCLVCGKREIWQEDAL